MFKKKLLVIMVVVLGSMAANSLNAQSGEIGIKEYQSLEKRISELERPFDKQMRLLDKTGEQLKQDFQNKKNELTNLFDQSKNEQAKEFNELKNNIEEKALILGGFLALIVIVSGFGIWSAIKLFSEKIAIKILAKNFEIKSKDLTNLLKEVKIDYEIKKNKKILVVTPKSEQDQFLKNFFSNMGFPVKNASNTEGRISFASFSNGQVSETDFDLIFFNDEGNSTPKNEIETYLQNFDTKTIRFYFGTKRIYSEKENLSPDKKNLTTFANARLQLYGNLMNALRFKF